MGQNTSTVRITNTTRDLLDEISDKEGRSKSLILADAVERYRKERFFTSINDGYAKLKRNRKAWLEEQEERELWDRTLGDGLEEV